MAEGKGFPETLLFTRELNQPAKQYNMYGRSHSVNMV
jgi:hypothetical protein